MFLINGTSCGLLDFVGSFLQISPRLELPLQLLDFEIDFVCLILPVFWACAETNLGLCGVQES